MAEINISDPETPVQDKVTTGKNGRTESSRTQVNSQEREAFLPKDPKESGKPSSNWRDNRIINENTTCGLFGWNPDWLQILASKKTYVIVYGLLGMNQFALGTYMVATVSTLEKRFRIPSRTSGLIVSSWDVGSLLSFIFTSYFLGRGHRTRWVAVGSGIVATACLFFVSPQFIYGAGEEALLLTREHGSSLGLSKGEILLSCKGGVDKLSEDCGDALNFDTSTLILSASVMLLGVGCSVYWTLGVAYLDDNVTKNALPILLASVSCIRMVGPSIGYWLASYALKFYVDPRYTATINDEDPRWIGAWWIGWIPLGLINVIFAFMIAFFPRTLPRAAMRMKDSPPVFKETSFKDLKESFIRLLKNKILVCNSLSAVCYMFGMVGYWNFMPKYFETQFRLSASKANEITGYVGLACTALGVITSGAVISIFKPRASYLAAWNVFVGIIDVAGHLSYSYIGCPPLTIDGHINPDQSWNITTSCNANCSCSPDMQYSPVCSSDGTTFYSFCHAGCKSIGFDNATDSKIYQDCICTKDMGSVTMGACPTDCGYNFLIFLLILSFLRFFSATGKAGNTIIQFRCVSTEDKSMSVGLTEALLAALAFIPGPIFYGALLDYTCMVWGQKCGDNGNCWLYNGLYMRYTLNFTASAFLFFAMLWDIGTWYYARGLKIFDDDDENEPNKAGKTKNPLEMVKDFMVRRDSIEK